MEIWKANRIARHMQRQAGKIPPGTKEVVLTPEELVAIAEALSTLVEANSKLWDELIELEGEY